MKGFEGKQADTAMLYFPLEYNLRHNISETVAQADLEFYAAHTAPSPDMTHAIQVQQQQQQQPHSRAPMRLLAILTVLGCLACLPTGVYVMLPLWVGFRIQNLTAWRVCVLTLRGHIRGQTVVALDRAALSTDPKWRALADAEFLNSYQKFCFPPYYLFSENSGNSGDVLYLTSGAGFLQALIYGYGGVRVLEGSLQLTPVLPPKATHFALKGIEYMGASLALSLLNNGTDMSVAMAAGGGGGGSSLTLTDSGGKTAALKPGGAPWTGPAQRVTLAAARVTKAL